MNTPICDFVQKYAKSENARFHMPGHKGKSFLGVESLDITEIEGADVLYNANGIIKQSEENASELFGSKKTLYSTEGSTLSIRAMLYLAVLHAKQNGRKPTVAAFRNVHKSFLSAAVMLDFDLAWLYSEKSSGIVSCEISSCELDDRLSKMSPKPTALYITSPDYLGVLSDIKGLSEVCKKHGILLLVDNAHGAYLKFLPKDMHPITQGADICCDSAHKTLPVLTGGAYLHISQNAPSELYENAEKAMSLFASTSPSYLILQSLDMANKYIYDGYREKLADLCEKLSSLKERLSTAGFELCSDEPMKLTIKTKPYGYKGHDFASILSEKNIICEFCDPDYVVLMPSVENAGDLQALESALLSIQKKEALTESAPVMTVPERRMSPREALLSASEKMCVSDSIGKILSDFCVSCPPAIPILMAGEVIDENAKALFDYYGINECNTVKE